MMKRLGLYWGKNNWAAVILNVEKGDAACEDVISGPRPSDEAAAVQALAHFLRGRKAPPVEAGLALPARLSVTKNIVLPSHNESEIAPMAELQICRLMPFSPEEVIIRHKTLEKNPDGTSLVAVTVLREDEAAEPLRALRNAGLAPSRILLDTQASAAAESCRKVRLPDKCFADPAIEAAIGAALGNPGGLDFLPHTHRREWERRSALPAKKTFALLAAILLLFWTAVFAWERQAKLSLSKKIAADIAAIEPDVHESEAALRNAARLQNQLMGTGSVVGPIAVLQKLLPKSVELKTLRIDRNRAVFIEGEAPALSDVVNLISLLENDGYFKQIQLKSTNLQSGRGKENVDFELEAGLSGRGAARD